ncbi:MAG: hypothetical protein ACYTG6_00220 [Planctomycetota bacterium]|jgi:hypothetical protein
MARAWPLLLLLVVGGLAGWYFLGGGGGGPGTGGVDREDGGGYEAPELRGHGLDRRPPEEEPGPEVVEPPLPPEVPDDLEEIVFLEGLVTSAETGEPLAGAHVWIEPHREPCPRLPAWGPTPSFEVGASGEMVRTAAEFMPVTVARGQPRRNLGTATDEEGRFRFRLTRRETPPSGSVDLYVSAAGHVATVRCAVDLPGEVSIELAKGLVLEGTVTEPRAKAVAGAWVRAAPAPETPAVPGHASIGGPLRTDEEGRFAIDGLLPGDVMVIVDHEHFIPQQAGPFDPAANQPVSIVLVPALRATFNIRTDDGRTPEHPTLLWRTTGARAKSGVVLLPVTSSSQEEDLQTGAVEGEITAGPVRIPCDAPAAILEIKADGYGSWRSPPLPLPSEGGEETFEVVLTGDLSNGSLRVTLEDDQGQKVRVDRAAVVTVIARIDAAAPPSAYVVEQTEDLRITSLPAGTYRLMLTSAKFAPVQTDVTINAGQETVADLRVGEPAKVKVRFFAPQQTKVLFRITQNGELVHAIPEGGLTGTTDEATGAPVLAAGSDGIVLSGLAGGTYAVEVLSEELTAPATLVHLREGDTVEVEIQVQFR